MHLVKASCVCFVWDNPEGLTCPSWLNALYLQPLFATHDKPCVLVTIVHCYLCRSLASIALGVEALGVS